MEEEGQGGDRRNGERVGRQERAVPWKPRESALWPSRHVPPGGQGTRMKADSQLSTESSDFENPGRKDGMTESSFLKRIALIQLVATK